MVIVPPALDTRSSDLELARSSEHFPLLLRLLEELSCLALSSESQEAVLDRLVVAGSRLISSRRTSLQLLDEQRRCLVRCAAVGLPSEFLTNRKEVPLDGPLAGVCGTCARTGKVVVVEDTQRDPLTAPLREILREYELAAAWSVPLIGRGDQVLGTLASYYDHPYRPTHEEVVLMEVLARHMAIAIETTRMMDTIRRQADALALSKLRLEAAFDQMQEGCVIIGPDRKLLIFNRVVREILGQDPPSKLCSPESEQANSPFLQPDGKPFDPRACPLQLALQGKTSSGVEMIVRRPEGRRIHLSVNAQPLWRKDGSLLGALAVFRDRTAELRIQEELGTLRRLSEELTTVETGRDAAQAGHQAALALFQPDCFCLELYDGPTDTLYPLLIMDQDELGEYREFLRQPLRACDELREVIQGRALAINRVTGKERLGLRPIGSGRRSASILFAPLRRKGTTVGLLSVQSYTLNRYTEADLPLLQELADLLGPPVLNAHLREELQARQIEEARHERLRALEQMAAGVAHNFNNTLTGVLGYADLLADHPNLDSEARSMICHIRKSAQDAAAIVSRLQQFYRPMDIKTEAQPLDLPRLVRETVESTRPRWHSVPQRSGTVVNVNLDLEAVPPMVGQPQDLRDALTNLLFNAVEAMPSGGAITISTRLEEDAVVLRIADNGVGMPTDAVEHCFEPFFLSKVKRGSGLGLPSVHGAVARHGGKISVQSELGRGTVFTIRFPLDGKPTAALVESPPRPPRQEAKTPFRVLVIDDEPAVRGVIEAMLSRNGHAVTLAPDGASGLKELESDTYNLIITDLGMPGMDGREVARRVKKLAPTMPVVLLTGWGQSAGSMEGMAIDAILQKPVGMRDLLAIVENLARS